MPERPPPRGEGPERVRNGGREDSTTRDCRRTVDLPVHVADPPGRTVARRERPEPAVVVPDEEPVAGDRGARGDLRAQVLAPLQPVRAQVERVHFPAGSTEVVDVVDDDRRRLDRGAGVPAPLEMTVAALEDVDPAAHRV